MNHEQEPTGVKMHPITLLSIVDHNERTVGSKRNKRAVGFLLGEILDNVYEITNSYAVPFEEAADSPGVWFLDHNYHESMFDMFRKINIKEKVLGWYTTGSTFKTHDLDINELISNYCQNPVLVVVDVGGRHSH